MVATTSRWFFALAVSAAIAYSAMWLPSFAVAQQRENATASAPTVLFMCPHGAAKSVLASAYFQRAAKERGLNVRVVSAGTDPDAQVAPAVTAHLKKNGYEVPVSKPLRATADDMAKADIVISIGCDLRELPAPRGSLEHWDDVPSPSDNLAGADASIRKHVDELIEELVRSRRR